MSLLTPLGRFLSINPLRTINRADQPAHLWKVVSEEKYGVMLEPDADRSERRDCRLARSLRSPDFAAAEHETNVGAVRI